MKKLTLKQMSMMIAERRQGEHERMMHRRAYENERDSYKSSPEGQFEQKVRSVTQKATNTEMEAYRKFVEATITLKEETIELIKEYLEGHADGREIKDFDVKEIQECLRKCYFAVRKLKILCEDDIYKENKTYGVYNEYEKMYNYLIDKVNIRFAFFAPEMSLRRKSIKYSKMATHERRDMFYRLKEFGITEMEGFEAAYGEVFEQFISKDEHKI